MKDERRRPRVIRHPASGPANHLRDRWFSIGVANQRAPGVLFVRLCCFWSLGFRAHPDARARPAPRVLHHTPPHRPQRFGLFCFRAIRTRSLEDIFLILKPSANPSRRTHACLPTTPFCVSDPCGRQVVKMAFRIFDKRLAGPFCSFRTSSRKTRQKQASGFSFVRNRFLIFVPFVRILSQHLTGKRLFFAFLLLSLSPPA